MVSHSRVTVLFNHFILLRASQTLITYRNIRNILMEIELLWNTLHLIFSIFISVHDIKHFT